MKLDDLVKYLDQRFDQLEKRLSAQSNILSSLKHGQDALTAKIHRMEYDLVELRSDVNSVVEDLKLVKRAVLENTYSSK